jgi:hypothetical protein
MSNRDIGDCHRTDAGQHVRNASIIVIDPSKTIGVWPELSAHA